jgi:hypothetical protein
VTCDRSPLPKNVNNHMAPGIAIPISHRDPAIDHRAADACGRHEENAICHVCSTTDDAGGPISFGSDPKSPP